MGAVITRDACGAEAALAEGKSKADRQEELVLLVAPYPLLVVSTILFAAVPYGSPSARPYVFAAVVAVAAWEFGMWTRPGALRERSQRQLMTYLIGGIALSGFLVVNGPWFAFFAWTFYMRLPMVQNSVVRWGGFFLVAAELASAQVGGARNLVGGIWVGFAALVLVNLLLAAGLAKLSIIQEQRHEERRVALLRVQETNRRLEATLAENEELQQEIRRHARESGIAEERARLAREIHDTIAQGLAGVVAQLEAARQPGVASPERHLQVAHQLARESLVEARRSVEALRPEALTGSRFSDALAGMAKRWGEMQEIAVEYVVTGEPVSLPPDSEVALFRVAQEALANAGKHSGADAVEVTLSFTDAAVLLDVRDNGTGFDVAAPPPSDGGYGIGVMQERIGRLGGYFEIESSPPHGTVVSAAVPTTPSTAPEPQ